MNRLKTKPNRMSKIPSPALLAAIGMAFCSLCAGAGEVRVSSLKELAAYATQNGNTIIMQPGIYLLADYLPLETMAARRERGEFQFITFSGSNNIFYLRGVTIEVDTALRAALRAPIHNPEFLISGNDNTFIGLEIITRGRGTSPGGELLRIAGDRNTLRDSLFWVQGSHPYGYGDLFGKGGHPVIHHRKHSGVLITGERATLIGVRIYMRAFGHGFFIQGGNNHHFEDCHVTGVMRSTDEMLAETSGPAFDAGFRSVYRNRAGEHRVTPGYMKSLAEDGFRSYTQAENLTFINCTARYMRGGFELRTRGGARIENSAAIGCERGFWLSTGAIVTNSRGDARYGPLLFLEGDNANVELELMTAESEMTVHSLATIHGSGHNVTIRPAGGENRARPIPIMVAYSQPGAGEAMSPYGQRPARNLVLRNETTMPVVIGPQADGSHISTRGPVEENAGSNIEIDRL